MRTISHFINGQSATRRGHVRASYRNLFYGERHGVLDDKVAREIQYFVDPFEPRSPCAQWVERIGEIHSPVLKLVLMVLNEEDAMHYLALATDYDGTVADKGVVDKPTLAALERLRGGARRLILVTGRELTDLQRVRPRLDLFDLVVAENGAVMYDLANQEEQAFGDAPPPAFVGRLRELGVASLWVGRVMVATWGPNEGKVLSAIHDLGLNLEITFNKGAVIVLPVGVTKANGLRGALAQLGLSPLNCIGVGDAENDLA